MHNTALALHGGMRSQILFVNTEAGSHAYLSDGQKAYSRGLTWTTSYYPELSLRQIVELNGTDVTTVVFWQALQVEEDRYGYHRVLERLEGSVPGIVSAVGRYYGL